MKTVWGVCDINGSSWIHKDKPVLQDFKGMLTWISELELKSINGEKNE